jgi:hypothetical protein
MKEVEIFLPLYGPKELPERDFLFGVSIIALSCYNCRFLAQ